MTAQAELDERLKEAQEKLEALYDEIVDFLNGLMIKDEELTRWHIAICLHSIEKELKTGGGKDA